MSWRGPHKQAEVSPAGPWSQGQPDRGAPHLRKVGASLHPTPPLWVQTPGSSAPRGLDRVSPPQSPSLWEGPSRARGETSANPATGLPPPPRAPATVAKGRGSTARSLRIPVAHEYLQVQLRLRPRCLGAQAPQPRGRKNYRVEGSARRRRAPGASAGARGPTPSGESRERLWVWGRRATVFPVPRGERRPRMERPRQGVPVMPQMSNLLPWVPSHNPWLC